MTKNTRYNWSKIYGINGQKQGIRTIRYLGPSQCISPIIVHLCLECQSQIHVHLKMKIVLSWIMYTQQGHTHMAYTGVLIFCCELTCIKHQQMILLHIFVVLLGRLNKYKLIRVMNTFISRLQKNEVLLQKIFKLLFDLVAFIIYSLYII